MRLYVEAYWPDDSQMLGNCDGQTVITAVQYKRTQYYKQLRGAGLAGWPKWSRPKFWRIVTESGQILETINNYYFK